MDFLNSSIVLNRKGRAQYFVAANNFTQAAGQSIYIQIACELNRVGKVVSSALRLKLRKQPQRLLRQRQRDWPRMVHPFQIRDLALALFLQRSFQPSRE